MKIIDKLDHAKNKALSCQNKLFKQLVQWNTQWNWNDILRLWYMDRCGRVCLQVCILIRLLYSGWDKKNAADFYIHNEVAKYLFWSLIGK